MTTRQGLFIVGGAVVGGALALAVPGLGISALAAAGLGAGAGGVAAFLTAGDTIIRANDPGPARLTGGAVGSPIPFTLGTNRVGGKAIWLGDRIDIKRKEEIGKNIGPSTKQERIESFRSFALAFVEGEIIGITRMWQNKSLFFDITSANATGPTIAGYLTDAVSGFTFPAPTTTSPGQVDTKDFGSFRIYLGSYDQLPDPLIQADARIAEAVGGSPIGNSADYVSAHRGLAYAVFENWPLAVSQGALPQIEAEVITAGANTYPLETVTFPISAWRLTHSVWSADMTKLHQLASLNDYKVADTQIKNLDAPLVVAMAQGVGTTLPSLQPSANSRIYANIYGTGPALGTFTYKMDSQTGAVIWISEESSGGGGAVDVAWFYEFPEGLLPQVVLKASSLGRMAAWNAGTGQLMWEKDFDAHFAPDSLLVTEAGWAHWPQEVDGALYIPVNLVSGAATIMKVDPLSGALIETIRPQTASPSSDDPFFTSFTMTYDVQTNSLILLSGSSLRRYSLTTNTVDAADLMPPNPAAAWVDNDTMFRMRPWQGQIWLQYSSGDAYARIDIASWTIVEDIPTASALWTDLNNNNSDPLYDPINAALVVTAAVQSRVDWLWQRLDGATVTLQQIVDAIDDRVGVPAAQTDTSALIDEVVGFMVAERITARRAMESLILAYNWDFRHQDFVLQAFKHGGAAVRAVPEDDLGAEATRDGAAAGLDLTETRSAELDMDQRIDVGFLNKALDHNGDVASFERQPEATQARDLRTISLPIVFADGTEPSQIAERVNLQAWWRRFPVRTSLTWEHLDLNVGDVITTTQNGVDYRLMIQRRAVDEDLIIQLDLVPENQEISTASAAPGVTNLGSNSQTVPAVSSVRFDVHDIPLLRDQDEGWTLYNWVDLSSPSTAFTHQSQDGGATFTRAISSFLPGEESDWGIATTTLPDADYHFTDRTNTLDVTLVTGALSSVTEKQALEGSNTFLLGSEVISAQTVTSLGGNDYRLSNIIRGRRGTDTQTGSHVANELFLVLSASTLKLAHLDATEVGLTRVYTATASGGLVGSGPRRNLAFVGNAKKPYAPDHVTAVRNADLTWTIDWLGRTRLGAGWPDGVATVLADTPEAWEVDVLDAPGGSVAVAKTGLSSSTVTLSTSDIQTAYGNPIDVVQVHLCIYQISTAVGRGFGRNVTLASTAAFQPTDLSGLNRWYDASLASTITLSGSSVTDWADRSPNGYDLTQGTASRRPQYTGTIGGLNVVDFDGANHWMEGTTGVGDLDGTDQPMTLVAVYQPDTYPGATNREMVICLNKNGDNDPTVQMAVRGTDEIAAAGGDDTRSVGLVVQSATISNPTNPHICILVKHATTVDVYIDAEQVIHGASFDLGAALTLDRFHIGTFNGTGGPGNFFDGTVGEAIAYDRALATSDLTKISDYLHSKWGVARGSPTDI